DRSARRWTPQPAQSEFRGNGGRRDRQEQSRGADRRPARRSKLDPSADPMTFQQKFSIVVLVSMAAAVGLALGLPSAHPDHRAPRPLDRLGVLGSLASIVVALLVVAFSGVGVVSHSVVRHVIQIAPLLFALGVGALWPRLRVAAALPLFTSWLFVMVGIWLFLLGIVPVFPGRYPPIEVTLTIFIG